MSNSFYLNCKVQGHFIFNNDEFPEEEKVKFFKVNGVSILFPYLRSLVSDLTSKGSEQPVILPTMNVAQMIKDQEEKHNKYK
ncbi:protein-export chaperone SecB [Bacillus subtilis]|uniref:protein-export chaperone SecB n=1 Tax=Bacillus subtilis TaxID=1423 RepID=UPI00138A645C|nr:protein-export chaperone SecB [Bacillus subtilis]